MILCSSFWTSVFNSARIFLLGGGSGDDESEESDIRNLSGTFTFLDFFFGNSCSSDDERWEVSSAFSKTFRAFVQSSVKKRENNNFDILTLYTYWKREVER